MTNKSLAIIICFVSGLAAQPGRALTLTPGTVWPSPSIPVCWERTNAEHRQDRQMIRKAVRSTWERESAVRFTGWAKCRPDSGGIRINMANGVPHTLDRGIKIDGRSSGMVLLPLWSTFAVSVNLWAAVHEFGHALGFGHEFARPDADAGSVCMQTSNGQLYVENDQALTPFDADSVMGACIANIGKKYTKGLPKLSAGDIFGLVQVYGANPDKQLGHDEAGDLFGSQLALLDFNNDNKLDLAVKAPGQGNGADTTFIYQNHGISGLRPKELRASDAATLDAFEASIVDSSQIISADIEWPPFIKPDVISSMVKGDLDGDGVDELVIGSARALGDLSVRSGRVFVFSQRQDRDQTPLNHWRAWYSFGQAY